MFTLTAFVICFYSASFGQICHEYRPNDKPSFSTAIECEERGKQIVDGMMHVLGYPKNGIYQVTLNCDRETQA